MASSKINDILLQLNLDDDSLKMIMGRISKCFEVGLSTADPLASTIPMLPTFVRELPNGTEHGSFLALDLGGSNFRILLIKIRAHDRHIDVVIKTNRIPKNLMISPGESLFDYLADCIAQFIIDNDLAGQRLPLGFTFSFPCSQDGLASAKLITWTKGFNCPGVEGEDVVKLLREAMKRRKGIDIDIVALLNDTVGTLVALAYEDPKCTVGIIVGTGTNACYLERVSKILKLPEGVNDGEMVINTEWGAFGDRGELNEWRTEFDIDTDRNSINPGRHTFEKMISGMYMGELVRLILLKLSTNALLFEGRGSGELGTKGKFPSKFVSDIESDLLDAEGKFSNTLNILAGLGIKNATKAECAIVANVCSKVSTRAAHLCAAGVAALLTRMERPEVTVGVDGALYKFHPCFKRRLSSKLQELLAFPCKFTFKSSQDGSGRGAALVAAVVMRMRQKP